MNALIIVKTKHINKCKKHVFNDKVHLDYLQNLHSKFVFVPVDKAANNEIIVCKKYYLDMVLNELNTTQTYNEDKVGFKQIISEHGKYMNKKVESNMEDLPY